jgi:hypothetical protein
LTAKSSGQHSNFLLKINCRNTKQVGEETTLISDLKSHRFTRTFEGIPVEYLFKDETEQRKLLASS